MYTEQHKNNKIKKHKRKICLMEKNGHFYLFLYFLFFLFCPLNFLGWKWKISRCRCDVYSNAGHWKILSRTYKHKLKHRNGCECIGQRYGAIFFAILKNKNDFPSVSPFFTSISDDFSFYLIFTWSVRNV